MAASSNPVATFPKDPDAVLDYAVDWSDWLGDDRILTSVWTVPVGISQLSALSSASINIIWLGGGTAGTSYSIVNRITTVTGRTEDRTIKINVTER